MKKLLILTAIAVTALASCAKTEVIHKSTTKGTPVTFGVYTPQMATKAVSATTYGQINTTALLQSSVGFGVFGYYSEGTANDYNGATPSNFTPNFMYNQLVTYNTDHWEYTPVKYWPNEYNETTAIGAQTDKLTFAAYAPHVTTVGDEGITAFSANNETGDPTVSFKVPASSANQIDLLWADNAVTTIQNLVKPTTNSATTFSFKHALSKLMLYPVVVVNTTGTIPSATGTDVAAGTVVKVNSITINGQFNQEGTLNLITGAWTSSAAASAQTVTYSPATPLDVTAINDKAEATAPCAEFLFIPSSSAQNYVITINYDYTTTDTALDGGSVTIHNTIHKTLSSVTFLVGKQLKLYIGLGLNNVVFDAAVADWTDDTPQEIWLPLNL